MKCPLRIRTPQEALLASAFTWSIGIQTGYLKIQKIRGKLSDEDFPIFLKEIEDMLCPSVHDNVFGILNPNSRHPSDLILTKVMNRAWAKNSLGKRYRSGPH